MTFFMSFSFWVWAKLSKDRNWKNKKIVWLNLNLRKKNASLVAYQLSLADYLNFSLIYCFRYYITLITIDDIHWRLKFYIFYIKWQIISTLLLSTLVSESSMFNRLINTIYINLILPHFFKSYLVIGLQHFYVFHLMRCKFVDFLDWH